VAAGDRGAVHDDKSVTAHTANRHTYLFGFAACHRRASTHIAATSRLAFQPIVACQMR